VHLIGASSIVAQTDASAVGSGIFVEKVVSFLHTVSASRKMATLSFPYSPDPSLGQGLSNTNGTGTVLAARERVHRMCSSVHARSLDTTRIAPHEYAPSAGISST
jgi:hypothetical protein